MQVPYLLRSVLSNGLPNLKSLDIYQTPGYYTATSPIEEGAIWREDESGIFHAERPYFADGWNMTKNFMHSIARGAPGLQELGLHGNHLSPKDIIKITPACAKLQLLERLYYDGTLQPHKEPIKLVAIPEFLQAARSLAESSPQLSMVTDTCMPLLPYVSAMISRAEDGTVATVVANMNGRGLQIGRENEPFLPNLCKRFPY